MPRRRKPILALEHVVLVGLVEAGRGTPGLDIRSGIGAYGGDAAVWRPDAGGIRVRRSSALRRRGRRARHLFAGDAQDPAVSPVADSPLSSRQSPATRR